MNRWLQPNSKELTHHLPRAMEKNHTKSVNKAGLWAEISTWNKPEAEVLTNIQQRSVKGNVAYLSPIRLGSSRKQSVPSIPSIHVRRQMSYTWLSSTAKYGRIV